MCPKICCIVLIMCVLQTNGEYLGETCERKSFTGVCKNINDCPSAVADIVKRKMPELCGFGHNDPIVCCKESFGVTTEAPRAPSTTEYVPEEYDYEYADNAPTGTCPPVDPALTSPRTGQKAFDKCIEYQAELVYPCVTSMVGAGSARTSKCKHGANAYIVGGEDAKPAEFPHMALLGFQPSANGPIEFSCGGSVISDWYILTAGHCISGRNLGNVSYALLGTLRRSDRYNSSDLYSIARIIPHPDYKSPAKYNDIALLKTATRMKLSPLVVPACLDVGKQATVKAMATGWGAVAYAGANADVLQKVNLTKFEDKECSYWHGPKRHMTRGFDPNTQICYGDKKQSKDTCGGDSGGPLQLLSSHLKCMYVVVGVTSFGRQCGNVGQPGVYTRVQHYVPWIESIVWP